MDKSKLSKDKHNAAVKELVDTAILHKHIELLCSINIIIRSHIKNRAPQRE